VDRSSENLTVLRNLVFVVAFTAAADIRDIFYMLTFPATVVSRFKSQAGHPIRPLLEILTFTAKAVLILAGVMCNLVFMGVAFWTPIFTDSLAETIINIFWRIFEGYAIWIFKDALSMAVLHEWMHRPQFYSWHKYHHSITKEMSQMYGANFDTVDLMIENASGTLFLLPIRWMLFGDPAFHMASYIIVFWMDYTCHSANPYTATFLNPILDYCFRPNVCHQLHHAVINDYFNLLPIWQLWPSKRQKDLEAYNKAFETDIDVY